MYMSMINEFILWLGIPSALAGAIYAIRKLYFWFRPLKIEPSVSMVFDNSGPDSIGVTITNRTQSVQYIRSCAARGTYPLKHILVRHLKRPLLSSRLFPTIWYGPVVYKMMDDSPIKLEPMELKKLKVSMHEHPLNAMHTPYFLVQVTLTTGRTMTSKKLLAPIRWRTLGMVAD